MCLGLRTRPEADGPQNTEPQMSTGGCLPPASTDCPIARPPGLDQSHIQTPRDYSEADRQHINRAGLLTFVMTCWPGVWAIPDEPPRCNAQTRDDPKATTRVQRQSQAAGIALFRVRTRFPPARYPILGRDPELGVQPSFIVRHKQVTASYRVTGDFYSCRFTIG